MPTCWPGRGGPKRHAPPIARPSRSNRTPQDTLQRHRVLRGHGHVHWRPAFSRGAISPHERGVSREWGDANGSDMTGRSMLSGGSWMGWVLRLIETGAESPVQGIDVMEISRPRDLGEIANLGLTLREA